MRNLLVVIMFLIASISSSALCAADMNTPAYWIERQPAPYAVVLDQTGIGALNSQILARVDQMADIYKMPDAIAGDRLREWLLYDPVPDIAVVDRYDAKGAKLKKRDMDALMAMINLDGVAASNPVRFGRVLFRADIRGFPTDEPFLRRPGETAFDTLQYSSIFPPSSVALLHTSKNGMWGFFQTPFTRGWMRLDKVAFATREDSVSLSTEPLVITGSSVEVYVDAGLTKPLISLPMGTVLDIVSQDALTWQVRLPTKGSSGELAWANAYAGKKADAHEGFLPYTPAAIITQAFKMLGERYGWGGDAGRRDCPEFWRDAFATVGVRLPRNSQQQLSAGVLLPEGGAADTPQTIEAVLTDSRAKQGITLLVTSTHVMLYLGKGSSGAPYVIHQAHGYTHNGKKHLVDRVVVSGLGYGKDKAGLWPLLGQVKSVTVVTLPPNGALPEVGLVSLGKVSTNGL